MNPPSLPHQQVLRDAISWPAQLLVSLRSCNEHPCLYHCKFKVPVGRARSPTKNRQKINIGESKQACFQHSTWRKMCFHTWLCLECIFFECFRHWSRLKAIIHLRGCTLTSFFLKQKRSYKQGVESTCFYIAHSLRVSPTNSQKNLFVFCLGIFDNSSSSMIAFWDVYTCKEKTIHGSVLESQI